MAICLSQGLPVGAASSAAAVRGGAQVGGEVGYGEIGFMADSR